MSRTVRASSSTRVSHAVRLDTVYPPLCRPSAAPDRSAIVRSTQSTQTVNCVVEPAARIDTKSNRQEQTAGGWLSACDQASIDVGTTDAPEAHPEVA